METEFTNWTPKSLLEVELVGDVFSQVRETLERIGIANYKEKKLWQVAQILHKRGKYYIVSNSELFALDGSENPIKKKDIDRRNRAALLLEEWNMIKIISEVPEYTVLPKLFVLKYSETDRWNTVSSYIIGEK